ncbi:hypothetical protein FQN54_008663 [Arachnomyces sp. PD_36]|nr:hypothetical protein FQN54_008663 [Arachnomyces sp. PD_36]
MDLVAGVRKEGSRGGRDAFKWTDVKDSQHRENYLGHSLMAPVGRWQKGKDLTWYAKGDEGGDAASRAEEERKEEIRRVKEAEQDALSRALGLPVAPKGANTNMTPLGGKEVEKAIMETADDDGNGEGVRGVGFGAFGGAAGTQKGNGGERIEAVGVNPDPHARASRSSRRERRGRSRSREGDRRRGRSRDRYGEKKKDHSRRDYERHHPERRRHRSRSGDRETRRRRSRSRSRSRERKREHGRDRHRRRDRSRSPDASRDYPRYSREKRGDYSRR